MMLVIPLNTISSADAPLVGGKAVSLAMMAQHSIPVPDGLCVTVQAYHDYVAATGLHEHILLELNRKRFRDMRWEELWDTSLRIRNKFLTTPLPAAIAGGLRTSVDPMGASKAVVVRSSAPGEDSARTSFAGLHESYVNVRGTESILEHIRLVWASLWSDAALLYRQELELDIEKSAMAVIVQELVDGEQSGVAFSENPLNRSESVIEAVYGLNQGLVDGSVEPDRWVVERSTGAVLSHTPAPRLKALVATAGGVRFEPVPASQAAKPPLSDERVAQIVGLAAAAEQLFGAPQDVEWTISHDRVHALQSRPVTARRTGGEDDRRSWYLSLRRSFESLQTLRSKIEHELVPAMIAEASRRAEKNLSLLSDAELADEIGERCASHKQWTDRYWNDFIPFAHGMRLFGQIYNDMVRPADPYEFMDLLRGTAMVSVERNRMLQDMAAVIRQDEALAAALRGGGVLPDPSFTRMVDGFLDTYGDTIPGCAVTEKQKHALIPVLLEMASRPAAGQPDRAADARKRTEYFFARFTDEQQDYAWELLDLARASYRMRDDDNLYLGKIGHQMQRAIDEAGRRLAARGFPDTGSCDADEVCMLLRGTGCVPVPKPAGRKASKRHAVRHRQLVGQPAGPGVGTGSARVIVDSSGLFEFKAGEILVCDAVDPSMTFVVPVSGGIVERRGGMLIHGAIIAREYGIACVSGVPDATALVHTGDQITVDGYLGIVTITRHAD